MIVESRSVRLGWYPVLIVSCAHFCLFADRALPSALAPALRARFGLSDTQLGALIGTAMIMPYAVATLAAGHWLGRFSPWRMMAWSILAWTAAAISGALAGSYGELLLARIAFGIAQAAFAPAALALLAASIAPRAAIATSVFSTGSASGRSGGLLVGGLLLMLAGNIALPGGIASWRIASLLLLIPNLILAFALMTHGRGAAVALPVPADGKGLGRALRSMAASPRAFATHFAASAAAVVIVQAAGAWAPSLLNRRFALDTAQSAILFGLMVLVAAPLGHLSAGRLAARDGFAARGPAAAMAGGAIGALLCCLALAFVPGLALTIVALTGLVACGGLAAGSSLIGLPPIVDSENRVAAMSLFFATTTLVGYGVGPLITGMLSDRLGGNAQQLSLALALVVATSVVIICVSGLLGTRAWRFAAGDRSVERS